LSWESTGFSVDNEVRVGAIDPEGRCQLARYMIRNPISREKMEYKEHQSEVVYRSKLNATLKRNFQIMPGAAWLQLLLQHVPDRGEHQVRYYGWYSKRCRGGEDESIPTILASIVCPNLCPRLDMSYMSERYIDRFADYPGCRPRRK